MKKFLDFKNFNFKWNKESAFIIILAGILCLVVVWPASGSPAGGGRKASGGGMACLLYTSMGKGEIWMVFNTGAALLDAIVLSVVSKEKDGTYGYKITQDVRQVIDISESTLYPVLRRLQKLSLIHIYTKGAQHENGCDSGPVFSRRTMPEGRAFLPGQQFVKHPAILSGCVIPKNNFFINFRHIPVSYTHLDVYKRQVQQAVHSGKLRNSGLIHIISIIFQSILSVFFIDIPVSYTHLIRRRPAV